MADLADARTTRALVAAGISRCPTCWAPPRRRRTGALPGRQLRQLPRHRWQLGGRRRHAGARGLSRTYMLEQMNAFRSGARQATVMHQLAKGYTDEQLALLADFFSQQKREIGEQRARTRTTFATQACCRARRGRGALGALGACAAPAPAVETKKRAGAGGRRRLRRRDRGQVPEAVGRRRHRGDAGRPQRQPSSPARCRTSCWAARGGSRI